MSDKRNNQYSAVLNTGNIMYFLLFSVYTNVIATDLRKCNLISRIVII